MYHIEFYEDSNGRSVLWDFLESLRVKAATNKDARIQYKQISLYIQLLEDNGTRLNENITKHLDDIWELRPDNNRVLYLCFCINSARKLKKLPSAKLNGQRLNVMITLPERRLNDYENLE